MFLLGQGKWAGAGRALLRWHYREAGGEAAEGAASLGSRGAVVVRVLCWGAAELPRGWEQASAAASLGGMRLVQSFLWQGFRCHLSPIRIPSRPRAVFAPGKRVSHCVVRQQWVLKCVQGPQLQIRHHWGGAAGACMLPCCPGQHWHTLCWALAKLTCSSLPFCHYQPFHDG